MELSNQVWFGLVFAAAIIANGIIWSLIALICWIRRNLFPPQEVVIEGGKPEISTSKVTM